MLVRLLGSLVKTVGCQVVGHQWADLGWDSTLVPSLRLVAWPRLCVRCGKDSRL